MNYKLRSGILAGLLLVPALAWADPQSDLEMAIADHRPAQVQAAIKDGADLEATDWQGLTPILQAASKGDLELVKLLATKGAKLDAKTQAGETLLMAAAKPVSTPKCNLFITLS